MAETSEKKQNWFMQHKVLTGMIIFFIILMIGGSGGNKKESVAQDLNTQPVQEVKKEETKPAEKPTEVPPTYETVDTKVMITEFDENQLAAEKKYEKKLIQFTAKIKNISEDIMGTPFLSLAPPTASDTYFGTTIKCNFKNKDDITTVKKNQKVIVKGEAQSQDLGIITVDNCQIVN